MRKPRMARPLLALTAASHGGVTGASGFSRLAQIDTASVARLGLAGSLDLPAEVTLEATPLEDGGVHYFARSHSAVHAASAGAPAPDLRVSQAGLSLDALWGVVHDDALERQGMPGGETLGRDDLVLIQTDIRHRGREVLAAPRP